MRARAMVHGAATVVNAIACGLGGAFGISLLMEAGVRFFEGRGITVRTNPTDESPDLAKHSVMVAMERVGVDGLGAEVWTSSNIPVGVGLKSSSAAANAITLASLAALGVEPGNLEIVKLGVEAAKRSGVTITGAFDDAAASFLGGCVITDNSRMRILERREMDEKLKVLIHVPPYKRYTRDVDADQLRRFGGLLRSIHDLALSGDVFGAITLNGLVYSTLLGFEPRIAMKAMEAGALAAGLSGTGPSTVALCHEDRLKVVQRAWEGLEGGILVASVSNEAARVVDRG